MAKNINTESFLSGSGNKLTITKYFLYELSIYKIYKDRVECINNKFYASNNFISIKKDTKIYSYKNFKIAIYIDWIGAPKDYIEENNFTLIIPKNKKKK